ncbi:MAG: alpha/beta fold hydrolase [Alphaproteobacteria bacterium]|nr:alpha/beta fold hydrolase [Alphaproteobacteria bacterium]
MLTTVYFATNRAISGAATDWRSYGSTIVSPSDPNAILYATAFVETTNLTADSTGAIASIQNATTGNFSASVSGDLRNAGRNLLIFIHGFDNSFENAITRAAFNREWLAASGVAGADTSVVAFTWPSLGQAISFPIPTEAYLKDQTMAGQSGFHLMSFLSRLQPIIQGARQQGRRVFLLAHSMGHIALEAAVEGWFSHGNGNTTLFDEVILAAADERFDSFEFPEPGRLSSLHRLGRHISIYYSHADDVLKLSELVNLGAQRLGQDGPRSKTNSTVFPPLRYRMVDCTNDRDYPFDPLTSHQYYRSSPTVRTDIALALGGTAATV